jgi:ankyrin repeat protein
MVIKLLGMCGEELVHIRSLNKRTALDYAARYGHMDVVQILAPIPQPGSSHSDYVSIALLEAVRVGDIEISRCLISEGADVNLFHGRSAGGSCPLYVAVCLRNLGLVQLLLISGADPDGDKPYIPLFVAARGGDLGILRALVGGGADIHVRDDQRRNVLVSCGTNMGPLCFFLERGVDPNNQDRHGQTVLQKACGKDHAAYGRDFVEVLCQYGAALDIANHDGKTAVDLAMENGLAGVLLIMERFAQSAELRARIAKWVRKRKRWAWGGANGPIW